MFNLSKDQEQKILAILRNRPLDLSGTDTTLYHEICNTYIPSPPPKNTYRLSDESGWWRCSYCGFTRNVESSRTCIRCKRKED